MITAKWLGQPCTVINSRDWMGTLIFQVKALPGQAFPDGSTMFSAYRPELTNIEFVDESPERIKEIQDHQAEEMYREQARLDAMDDRMMYAELRMGL